VELACEAVEAVDGVEAVVLRAIMIGALHVVVSVVVAVVAVGEWADLGPPITIAMRIGTRGVARLRPCIEKIVVAARHLVIIHHLVVACVDHRVVIPEISPLLPLVVHQENIPHRRNVEVADRQETCRPEEGVRRVIFHRVDQVGVEDHHVTFRHIHLCEVHPEICHLHVVVLLETCCEDHQEKCLRVEAHACHLEICHPEAVVHPGLCHHGVVGRPESTLHEDLPCGDLLETYHLEECREDLLGISHREGRLEICHHEDIQEDHLGIYRLGDLPGDRLEICRPEDLLVGHHAMKEDPQDEITVDLPLLDMVVDLPADMDLRCREVGRHLQASQYMAGFVAGARWQE